MLIYIKTPFYKNSKYIPHLVEHCANHELNINNNFYLKHIYNTDASTYSNYTIFDFPDYFDINDFIKQILKPLNKQTIKNEQKVLKEELKESNYNQKLFEKIGKNLHGKDFNNNKISKIELTEVINYHKKYYRLKNMVICNDKYKIINNPKHKDILKTKKKTFKYFDLKVNDFNNKIIYSEYDNWQDYYLFFFIKELLNSYLDFKYRFKKGIYYYQKEVYFFQTKKYNILAISGEFDIDFNEEFFINFKNTCIKIIKYSYGKKGIIINKLLLNQYISIKQVTNYIKKLNYLEIKYILQQFK